MQRQRSYGMRFTSEGAAPKTSVRGRTCAEPECETVLSVYNSSDRCWEHRRVNQVRRRNRLA